MNRDGVAAAEAARVATQASRVDALRSGLRTAVQAVYLLVMLTASDLRARHGRGPWQLAKWLADPFAILGVYLALVTFVLDRPGRAPGLMLACAVVPFQFVMATVVNSMNAVRLRRAIILNMGFNRMLLPVSAVLTETVAFGASLGLLALMMVAYGVAPTTAVLWLPAVLAANVLVAVGLAYPASLFGLWFTDLQPFAISFVRALFYVAPGLVVLAEIPGRAGELMRLNPLTGLFESYRDALLFAHRPAAWQLLIPVGVALVLFALFVPIYRREQRHFAKVVE